MEDKILYLAIFVLTSFFLLLASRKLSLKRQKNLPPTPLSLPIVGHLHLIRLPLHQSLNRLSQKYGSIFYLRFGSQKILVISSPSAVEECLVKNDVIFANRPPFTLSKYISYNNTTLSTTFYGDHWRNLRRIGIIEVLSSNRLNYFSSIRRDEVTIFLKKLYNRSSNGLAKLVLRPMLKELTLNIIIRMIAGKRYYREEMTGKEKEEAEEFKEMVEEIFKYAGASYIGDFLPILKWIDYGGTLKRMKILGERTDKIWQGIIDEHREKELKNTMISHLLSLQQSEPEYYTDEVIKGLMLDFVVAASESSAITIEWVMSNLLNHPQVMEKAKKELSTKLDDQENLIYESDLSKLPYLQNIITETLRLHPAGPLLIPHFSSTHCKVGGYNIEPNTWLLVNAWTIHRDPMLWENAAQFKPERFENRSSEGYKFLGFGLGRRSCPGMGLANRVVGSTLASMVQCFEWGKTSDQQIDMSEGVGLTMPKAQPLEVMCKPRDIMTKVLSSSA
uniref:Cytochrome p450 n=1 Tax=Croton stellatopilosus TaxID=431156 RepID=A0A3G2CJZ0_9ROSI|nr:cytochrome p450 [Croton stellatopilosus]